MAATSTAPQHALLLEYVITQFVKHGVLKKKDLKQLATSMSPLIMAGAQKKEFFAKLTLLASSEARAVDDPTQWKPVVADIKTILDPLLNSRISPAALSEIQARVAPRKAPVSAQEEKAAPPATETTILGLHPYEGAVFKRQGGPYDGVVLPNFRTCCAIVLANANHVLIIHYPSRVFSQHLPATLNPWLEKFSKEPSQLKAFVVINPNYPEQVPYTTASLIGALKQQFGITFMIIKPANNPDISCDFLQIDTLNLEIVFHTKSISEDHPELYTNVPATTASLQRYWTSRTQFYSHISRSYFDINILDSDLFLQPQPLASSAQFIKEDSSSLAAGEIQPIVHRRCNNDTPEANALDLYTTILQQLRPEKVTARIQHYLMVLLTLIQNANPSFNPEPVEAKIKAFRYAPR